MELELIQTFVKYHLDMTRRVWESIDQISEEQFLADDAYSRGSIRNLMVHLANTDSNWLAGLKNIPESQDPPKRKYEDYPDRASVHAFWEATANDVSEYVEALTEAALEENPTDIPSPRWQVLLHIINHGTDHRSTVLQRLHEFGASTFDQDLIFWLWSKK
ncbi:MAG TPA: DinB family protein [Anaerolineales bacterium]|nr:DinB family protein [Anaerolineales bacterium]